MRIAKASKRNEEGAKPCGCLEKNAERACTIQTQTRQAHRNVIFEPVQRPHEQLMLLSSTWIGDSFGSVEISSTAVHKPNSTAREAMGLFSRTAGCSISIRATKMLMLPPLS